MASGPFDTAFDAIDDNLTNGNPDASVISDAFQAVQASRPATMTADQLRRMFAICYRVLGLDGNPALEGLDENKAWLLPFQAKRLIEETFHDPGNNHRDFTACSIRRWLALGRPNPEGAPTEHIPRQHIPLDPAEALALATPYLSALEAQIAEDPCAHLKLCWDVMEHPQTPFDRIFEDWLDRLDQNGIGSGNERGALDHAFALHCLSEEACQRLSWQHLREDLMPELCDPHPMVVSQAARFIGVVMADPEDHINPSPAPVSMAECLDQLRGLSGHRRAAAGGFLQGIDSFNGRPITELRNRDNLQDFDIEQWALDILEQGEDEPSLPGSQAFWFYLHEEYCANPDFINRLLDAGHDWVALMCATEIQDTVPELHDVLVRLSQSQMHGIARRAINWLKTFHSDAKAGEDEENV